MKYARLSLTSKIYLLTLPLIFGVLFLNQSASAQSPLPQTSSPDLIGVSHQRLAFMERYMSWIESGAYGKLNADLGKKAQDEFKSYLSRVILEDNTCLKETEGQKLSDCKKKIKSDYKLARKYNRFLKYLQIEEGKSNICVKADLGVGTALKAKGINADGSVTEKVSTVYLCTNNKGEKILRVQDESGNLLKLSQEDEARKDLKIKNIPPKNTLDILTKKLGLTASSGEIFANPNPCVIPQNASTCGKVKVEWDVSDETSDPVEVKTKDGKFIEKSRNGSADILDIGAEGETFILYSLGRKINEVTVRAIQ